MDKWANEVHKSLRAHGYDVRVDHTSKFASAGDEGRSDVVATLPDKVNYIEIKSENRGFKCSSFREEQRNWTHKQLNAGYSCWLWIICGSGRPNSSNCELSPRKSFLVPAGIVFNAISMMENIQDLIPYAISKNSKKVIKSQLLTVQDVFAIWELKWNGGGIWKIPESHPLYNESKK